MSLLFKQEAVVYIFYLWSDIVDIFFQSLICRKMMFLYNVRFFLKQNGGQDKQSYYERILPLTKNYALFYWILVHVRSNEWKSQKVSQDLNFKIQQFGRAFFSIFHQMLKFNILKKMVCIYVFLQFTKREGYHKHSG